MFWGFFLYIFEVIIEVIWGSFQICYLAYPTYWHKIGWPVKWSIIRDILKGWCVFTRSALREGSTGCRETSGDHFGRAEEDVCPAASAGSAVLRSSPGTPDGAEDAQPLPRRDAHILESERPQIYPAALWDLGRAVTRRKWRMITWTFQLARQGHGSAAVCIYMDDLNPHTTRPRDQPCVGSVKGLCYCLCLFCWRSFFFFSYDSKNHHVFTVWFLKSHCD